MQERTTLVGFAGAGGILYRAHSVYPLRNKNHSTLCFFALVAEKKNFLSQNQTKSDLKSAIFVINHVFKTYIRASCTKSFCSLPGWRPRPRQGCMRAR